MGDLPMLGSPAHMVLAYPMAGLPVPSQCRGAPKITPLPHPTLQGVAEAELEKDIGRTLKALIRSTRPEVGEELGGKRIDLGGGSKRIWGWLYTVYSALQACSTHGCCPFCLQHSLH